MAAFELICIDVGQQSQEQCRQVSVLRWSESRDKPCSAKEMKKKPKKLTYAPYPESYISGICSHEMKGFAKRLASGVFHISYYDRVIRTRPYCATT